MWVEIQTRKNIVDRVTMLVSPVNFERKRETSALIKNIKINTANDSDWANRMAVDERFSVVGYVLFSVMLLLSALIGIWYGCGPGGRQNTTAEYLLGNRQMKSWPIAISILVSFLSGYPYWDYQARYTLMEPSFMLLFLATFWFVQQQALCTFQCLDGSRSLLLTR